MRLQHAIMVFITLSVQPAAGAAPSLTPDSPLRGRVRITADKPGKDMAWAVLDVEVKGVPESARVRLRSPGDEKDVPFEEERVPGGIRIRWVAPLLAGGAAASWDLEVIEGKAEKAPARVEVRKSSETAIQVLVDGKEITTLRSDPAERKPYFFPILGPGGNMMTREFPMRSGVPGEKQDHPHQRSLWFTHGEVGGVDFWAEGRSSGVTRQVKAEGLEGGAVRGKIVTLNEWIAPGGKKLLDDRRTFTIYPLEKGEMLFDVEITLTANEGPVEFGDTKEGTFGIRLAESMREDRGGTIVSSRGARGAKEAWGKPAEWVDYSGKVGGDLVGVAILDHPGSFRHPTHWHVRDYGLFAANPFGYREFYGKGKDGSFTLEKGSTMEFRYRVYFHHGDAGSAKVAQVYEGFAHPPALRVEMP